MRTSRSAFSRLPISVLFFALSACNASEPAATAAAPAPSAPSAPATSAQAAPSAADSRKDLISRSRISCQGAQAEERCTAGDLASGDYYDVDLSLDCGAEGFFAGVAQAQGAALLSEAPATGSKATTTAKLSEGQLVCVRAIARAGQNPSYYYVVAIPSSTVSQCKGNALCQRYGDRPIQLQAGTGKPICEVTAPGQYTDSCAQGWIASEALDVFSNGM